MDARAHDKTGEEKERVTSIDARAQNISHVLKIALPVDQYLVGAIIKMVSINRRLGQDRKG